MEPNDSTDHDATQTPQSAAGPDQNMPPPPNQPPVDAPPAETPPDVQEAGASESAR